MISFTSKPLSRRAARALVSGVSADGVAAAELGVPREDMDRREEVLRGVVVVAAVPPPRAGDWEDPRSSDRRTDPDRLVRPLRDPRRVGDVERPFLDADGLRPPPALPLVAGVGVDVRDDGVCSGDDTRPTTTVGGGVVALVALTICERPCGVPTAGVPTSSASSATVCVSRSTVGRRLGLYRWPPYRDP